MKRWGKLLGLNSSVLIRIQLNLWMNSKFSSSSINRLLKRRSLQWKASWGWLRNSNNIKLWSWSHGSLRWRSWKQKVCHSTWIRPWGRRFWRHSGELVTLIKYSSYTAARLLTLILWISTVLEVTRSSFSCSQLYVLIPTTMFQRATLTLFRLCKT